MVAVDGLLHLADLFRGHIAGDVLARFVALMVVIGPGGTLANHAQGAALQVLDLRELAQNRLRSGFCIHGRSICLTHILPPQKKGRKLEWEEVCLTPVIKYSFTAIKSRL